MNNYLVHDKELWLSLSVRGKEPVPKHFRINRLGKMNRIFRWQGTGTGETRELANLLSNGKISELVD